METIHIYHTNDVHSHLDSWPRTRSYLQERRAFHEQHDEACLIVDIGDFIDRSNIFTEATLGKSSITLLNEANYDAVTIGNNEGITLAKEALNQLYTEAKFNVIVNNLKEPDGKIPTWAEPYHVYTLASGTKLGVVAATAPFPDYYNNLGWKIEDPFTRLHESIAQARKEADIIICLSHLGLHSDERLAEQERDVTLIFGSHTHHVLEHGKYINQTLLTGGGKYGRYIGHSIIHYDGMVQQVETELIDTTTLPPERGEHREVAAQQRYGEELLDVEVFETTRFYNKEWYHYSKLSHFFAEALLDFSGADCAFFNAGIFLTDMKKGPVTALDIHRMLPHPINACIFELNEAQLRDILAIIERAEEWPRRELRGLGFRGTVVGKMLTYHFKQQDGHILVNDKILAPGETVKVATLDMFTFGWFFPALKALPKTYLLPQFLRDILTIYGHKHFV
ncbi:5'-nucleotidase [Kurthia sp. 3B1D]|uniref:5'-nucleotidase n=1 Tax=Candidatus Kurthia intestinigallinarum TaxID=1562256 RepID=A0A433RWE8_9BACL|nr:bifunctional UDP-sugar hydrolase/5'-nucleotidase [Kurthia sp. 3B1D]RUS57598.1 5'-nucleotidase [Kurthia sp. 3B1D]